MPKNRKEILSLYDEDTMPNIIVYKPFKPEVIPLVEFYRSPILFSLHEFETFIIPFYKEYRTLDDGLVSDEYYRELNIVYQKP